MSETVELNTTITVERRDFGDKRGSIRVYPGGRLIDPLNACQDDIDIHDIAHALSNVCRYGGHVREHFSVAEHCVRVSQRMAERVYYNEPTLRLAALLHDAEEAYLGDMVSPLKAQPDMAVFRRASEALQRVIYAKFGVDHDLIHHCKWADDLEYYRERRDMWPADPKDYVKPMSHSGAEAAFLTEFYLLQTQIAAKVAT